jgi:pyruvate/2-oxoglutarate dehydrogenase complex dihydrolipoamide dehydrogenase (E3) component
MSITQFDAIVIGTGQAGPSLASRLASAGRRVAVIERGRFGGTCVNTGCIPTKAMVASAYAAFMARRASEFGVVVPGPVTVDMKQVKARRDHISGESNQGVESMLKNMDNCTVYQGHARFDSPHTISVGDARLGAEHIFLNVGGRAAVPEIPGLHDSGFLNNSSIMHVDFVPEHLVIIGGSYIGLEFGQMFRRFGSQVSILQHAPRLVEHEDEDVSAAIKKILEAENIDVRLNVRDISIAKNDSGIVITANSNGTPLVIRGSHLLLATGRRPNTDDLGLDQAGISTDVHGYIQVDDQLRTNVDGVWALGDCNGKGAFTHTSYNDFEIVAANLLDNGNRRVSDRIPVHGMFIDPPLGRVGMSVDEVRQTGRKALVAKRPMTRVGRAVEKGESKGFMKVVVDAESEQILGAAILGTGGDEAVHCILDVMYARMPYTLIKNSMHIHPTVSELIPTLLGDLKPLDESN